MRPVLSPTFEVLIIATTTALTSVTSHGFFETNTLFSGISVVVLVLALISVCEEDTSRRNSMTPLLPKTRSLPEALSAAKMNLAGCALAGRCDGRSKAGCGRLSCSFGHNDGSSVSSSLVPLYHSTTTPFPTPTHCWTCYSCLGITYCCTRLNFFSSSHQHVVSLRAEHSTKPNR